MTINKLHNYRGLKKVSIIFLLILSLYSSKGYAQNELDVISNKWLEYSDASNSLYHYLTGEAYLLLKKRADEILGLKTLESWKVRQEYIRSTLKELVGPFPEKTPLNARVIRTITKPEFKVEHIIFESQPKFYVTSSLYIPSGVSGINKAPAVIYCSGHTEEGYRSAVYQHVIMNLVYKGFIVFAFDPVGQGERLEYFDTLTLKSNIGSSTKQHSYPGAQAFITGSSQANYMIWDGIRAVDYLLTRDEVDPLRIGITGRSGGGTQSAYIAAMDERIYAAAPENYITNYTRLLQTIGPQDAEQNITNLIGSGLDHPDFLIVRAPLPALMITTSGDMFSIQGAIETEKEVAEVYKAYSEEDNFGRVEDDAGHASTLKNREAMYAFFQKHLKNEGNSDDEETLNLTSDELKVCEEGLVNLIAGSQSVFSLNRKRAEELYNKVNRSRAFPDIFLHDVIEKAKSISGFLEPSVVADPVLAGRIVRDNYIVEKYIFKGEGDYIIPYLLFKPVKANGRALIYLNPAGKALEAKSGGEIEKFVNMGFVVLAPDLIGTGEVGSALLKGDANFNGVSHNMWYAAILTGRSITGIQSSDVIRLVRLLERNNEIKDISGFARKELAPVLLHAASFCKDIGTVCLFDSYSSFKSIVMNRNYYPAFIPGAVAGALEEYDLTDLAASIAPRKLFIGGMTGGNGDLSDITGLNTDIGLIKKAYQQSNAKENLIILTGNSNANIFGIYLDWIK